MCECGCEDTSPSTDMQSTLRERHRDKTVCPPEHSNNPVRRRLTYDDDYGSAYSPAGGCQYPRQPQACEGLNSIRNPRGLAIVQPQQHPNATLDYAGAVRRQNSNGRSRVSQKFRAALPPRGRTPCDPAYQSSSSRLRGGLPINRQN